jgi:outer membrane protein assembly factor BamB
VLYEDFGRTLVLSVLQSFAPGEYVSISGLAFKDFIAPSPSDNLELEVGNDDLATDSDDKSVTIVPVWDLQVLTARATHLEVKLEWVNPPVGACDSVLILARTDTYPTSPFDVLARLVGNPGCTLGATDFLTDSVPDDVAQFYTAWVYDAVSDGYSFGKLVKARAFDSVPGPMKWAYSTGASSMAPPGLRFQGASSYVYAVSNDSILHSLNGDASGGDWPSTWTPFRLGAPAQARPPVVSIPVGGATGAAFLGSQDGAVYAVDAQSGAPEWSRTIATMVQAAPVGNFLAFDATASNLILVGTRNSSLPNSLEALDVDTGLPAWSFTNSVSQGGNGKGIGIISGGATVHYASKRLYFASRVRTSGSSDTLWCVDFSSGSPTRAWSLPLGNIDGSPVLYGGVVYVGTNAGVVHAVDASGAPLWSLALGDGPIKGFVFPQFGSSNVFVSTNGKVWSLAAGAPNPGWPVTIPSPSIPLYVPGTMRVLVGSSNGRLYQMDAVTPTPTESVLLGDGAGAVGAPSLNVKNSLVYVGTDGGIIYAVEFPLP